MKINNVITVFAVVVIMIALVNLSVTIIKISDFNEQVTGFASGYVNLTVATFIDINLSRWDVNFSSGSVSPGQTSATLQTNGLASATVTNGNWSTGAEALIIENSGNVNISLNLSTANNATDLFGNVTTVAPQYQWNVSNYEVGSCNGGTMGLDTFVDANETTELYCGQLESAAATNEVMVDIKLVVPYDGVTGTIVDTITVTASTAQ